MTDEQYADLAELAGGFIHDIKNHLSTLSLNLQLLGEDFESPQSPRERKAAAKIERLREECRRLQDLSNDFLRFARVKDLNRQATHLPTLFEEMVDFFAPMARSTGIEIKSYLPADLPAVEIDRELFKQALLNLLLNAQQAMPEGGTLTLQAVAEPEQVRLELIDTGKGMAADVLAQIFKPFYTTKPGGSGLGLPTARKILLAHGGNIQVESAVGVGTKFTLSLPRSRDEGSAAVVPLADLNGRMMPVSEARISVLDRGFLFGDGVYEVLRVYRGKPWLEDEHFDRLDRSLREIRLEGVNVSAIRQRMHALLKASGLGEATVYLEITRGAVAPRTHAFPKQATPTELLWVAPYDDRGPAELRRTGARVCLYPDLRWGRCDVKSVNLLGNVLASQAAKEAGCLEALLFTPDDRLTECSHSSFFGVLNGVLISTPLSPAVLPSITRAFAIRLARQLNLPVEERALHRAELSRLEELFVVGTTVEVMPIIQADTLKIGSGSPGPITRRLQQAHNEAVAAFTGA